MNIPPHPLTGETALIKVKLNVRMIARNAKGKCDYYNKGATAYLDDETFKHHDALGKVEAITDEPDPIPTAEPEPDEAVAEPAEAAEGDVATLA